jgi:uncharacterized protein YraI
VGQASDSDYATGEVGFLVETFDSPRVHIHYGGITIREVQAPQLACTVVTPALNVRGGPGTNYPILTAAARGARLEPLAHSPDGLWLQVRMEGSSQPGWVASSTDLVSCNVPVKDLPVRQP